MDENSKDIARLFLELTKYKNQKGDSAMSRGEKPPPPEYSHPESKAVISLPKPDLSLLDKEKFSGIIQSRRSRRTYASSPLPLVELSLLLFATQGVQEKGDFYHLKTVPSAGARHPLETYMAINRVDGLDSGLYHYLPFSHGLELLRKDEETGKELRRACLDQDMFTGSAVNFIWSSVFYRTEWKYKERGLRYVYLDAGHVCQNLYLACEALGLACCAVAAFDDDACNRFLGIDGKEQFCLYMATVGGRRQTP